MAGNVSSGVSPSWFVQNGYLFLNFDCRGSGESDIRLLTLHPMPEPDVRGKVTVKASAVRRQMDFADQTTDIRNAVPVQCHMFEDMSHCDVYGTYRRAAFELESAWFNECLKAPWK